MSFAIELLLENLLEVGRGFVENTKAARRYAKQLQDIQEVLSRFDRKKVLEIAANQYGDHYNDITKYLYLNIEAFSGGYVEIDKEELAALRDIANNWAEIWQLVNELSFKDKVHRRYLEPVLEKMRPLVTVVDDERSEPAKDER